jgi:phosphoribosylformylglycinamidine cyclo-ligase
VITCGAKPLYFLDYISLNTINPVVDDIMEGIIKGCEIAGVELIGGETAEHPRATSIDLAGFCTGIVEKNEVIDGSLIKPGDQVIGIESSGLHSNGYSLINDMLWRHKIFYRDTPELLTPTTIYAPIVKQLLNEVPILGMAHITGGGLFENLSRCLPKGLTAHIDWNAWSLPKIFSKVMCAGEIPEEEMKRVFNLGIGYCVVVPEDAVEETQSMIGLQSWVIGDIIEGGMI